jgi:hypothetical protein
MFLYVSDMGRANACIRGPCTCFLPLAGLPLSARYVHPYSFMSSNVASSVNSLPIQMRIHCTDTANAIELGPPDAIVKDPLSPVDEYCTIITEVTDIQIQYLVRNVGYSLMISNCIHSLRHNHLFTILLYNITHHQLFWYIACSEQKLAPRNLRSKFRIRLPYFYQTPWINHSSHLKL